MYTPQLQEVEALEPVSRDMLNSLGTVYLASLVVIAETDALLQKTITLEQPA